MLNIIEQATIERSIGRIQEKLAEVELFLTGNPISTARIKDASIETAQIADLSITNAKFANLAITNAKFGSVDAAKFTAGTISADRIAAGTITASKLDVTTLSAISADMGTLTVGTMTGLTVTGATIRTAASGTRIEMTASPNALIIYDGSTEKVRIDPDGLKVSNMGVNFINAAGTLFKAGLNTSTSPSAVTLHAENCDEILFINGKSGGDIQIVAADGIIYMTSDNFIKINGTTKTAIVPTSQGYNALYCLEAPEVWFFDFIKDEFDPLFLEATEPGEINGLKTDQGELLVFRKRRGAANTRFASKTVEQFDRNNAFWGAA